MHVQSCCFAYKNLLFFFYLLAAVRVFGSLKVPNDAGSRAAPTTWYNGGDVYD